MLGKELPTSYRQASRNWQDYVSPDSEYYVSPAHILVAVRKVFGGKIDLDPCSDEKANDTVQATKFYTAEDDGLLPMNVWSGRVYINPPSGMLNNDSIQVSWYVSCARWPPATIGGGNGGWRSSSMAPYHA